MMNEHELKKWLKELLKKIDDLTDDDCERILDATKDDPGALYDKVHEISAILS